MYKLQGIEKHVHKQIYKYIKLPVLYTIIVKNLHYNYYDYFHVRSQKTFQKLSVGYSTNGVLMSHSAQLQCPFILSG